MNITYDRKLLIAGMGVTPWTRVGLERWFDNYHIVAMHAADAPELSHMPPVKLLGDTRLSKQNTQQIVRAAEFMKLANGPLAGFDFSTYRPVEVDDPALRERFIMNDPKYSRTYENKAWFREQLGAKLPFAQYSIYRHSELKASSAAFAELSTPGLPFVMQHEQLSGGKGTFIVRSYRDYVAALESLPPKADNIVVSRYIDGAQERSMQCCVTRYGTVYGPLQKQIVRDPLLCNLGQPAVNGFAGGEIGTVAVSSSVQRAVRYAADTIGRHMAAGGYKGIFGIDFLIRGEEVYVLEVNARLTGLTPLLTIMSEQAGGLPFYLLHTLELGGYDYAVPSGFNFVPGDTARGSLLILQSQSPVAVRIIRTIASGVYLMAAGGLKLIRRDAAFAPDDRGDAILIQQYASPGEIVKPGARIVACMTRQAVLDQDDVLLPRTRHLVKQVYGQVVTTCKNLSPML